MADTQTLRQARVLFKDMPAGLLSETPEGGSRFTYNDAWSDSIACALPAAQRVHDWRFGLHPFFQHLGAEGWLREQQARSDNLDAQDDFGLLLRYGADCIGAVSLQPLTPPPARAAPTRNAGAGKSLAAVAVEARRTLSGVQRKLLVYRPGGHLDDQGAVFYPAGADNPADHIAKFSSDSLPTLVRNEFLSLTVATQLLSHDEVTAFERRAVLIGEQREDALVVRRFDRLPDGAKLRLEDCAQILAKPRGPDFNGKYDAGYEDVAGVIRAHSARPEIDLDKFFRLILVNALIGNCDAHLKNFSLLERPEGLRLSPAYDILNTLAYPEFKTEFGLSISGVHHQTDQLNRKILSDFGTAIGLNKRIIGLAFETIHKRWPRALASVTPPDNAAPDEFLDNYIAILRAGAHRVFET